jgi:RNA-directed DNA polymerase
VRFHAPMLTQGQTRWSTPPSFVMQHSFLVDALVRSLLAGEQTPDLLFERCSETLGCRWRWLRPLAQRYLTKFGNKRPRCREVVLFLRNDAALRRAWAKYSDELTVVELLTPPQKMLPARTAWDVPAIESTGDLAKWLGLNPGELRWFADLKELGYKQAEQRLQHYHYRIVAKRSGNIRLIESPKPRLKDLQRQILIWILEKVPPHPSVHGFVQGRSIKTFVAPHVARRIVFRIDLQDFFPTLGGVRIQNAFRALGYPESVADLLGGICTNATPRNVWTDLESTLEGEAVNEAQRLYARPHLPQGAPTSPALANLCFYRVDCRLNALAKSSGTSYTRYADDLAFSGDEQFARRAERFGLHVAAVLLEEGFRVNHRKTRIMRQGVCQRLAGIVTNQRMNPPRRDFDRLKALLTNCARHGPASQNRESRPHFREYLRGKISFAEMINPAKAKKLRSIFEKIQWEEF